MRRRAAASSSASGRPSRRRQIAAIAAALAVVSAKPGFTFSARWTMSATDGHVFSASSDVASCAGSSSGGRPNSDSAPILSGARLVAITCSDGQRETSAAMSAGGVEHLLEIVEHQEHAASRR